MKRWNYSWQKSPRNKWEYENRDVFEHRDGGDFMLLKVNTNKAVFHGEPWTQLNTWRKRKWENLAVLAYAPTKVKFDYR